MILQGKRGFVGQTGPVITRKIKGLGRHVFKNTQQNMLKLRMSLLVYNQERKKKREKEFGRNFKRKKIVIK